MCVAVVELTTIARWDCQRHPTRSIRNTCLLFWRQPLTVKSLNAFWGAILCSESTTMKLSGVHKELIYRCSLLWLCVLCLIYCVTKKELDFSWYALLRVLAAFNSSGSPRLRRAATFVAVVKLRLSFTYSRPELHLSKWIHAISRAATPPTIISAHGGRKLRSREREGRRQRQGERERERER